jgi:Ni,Fe-hydrogenase maturation factor
MQPSSSVLILGIGNVLWADEGFGVRSVDPYMVFTVH